MAKRYEPLEIVGRGGEAYVLKAVDTRHQRLVALKVRAVPPDGSTDRLLAETRALLSLPPCPGLAHARDDFFDRGRYVLVLDWVDGVDLAQLLVDEGRPGMPASSVLHWVAQVAEALSLLHHHGVVHGDVKPANLILDRTGRIVLVDLGSASAPRATSPGGGTSGFRAPEVAAGAPPVRASDVFSLAATAFALLTGTPPTGARPVWAGQQADVAARFESALRVGLAIDPTRRPATPGELVERLRAGWDDQTPTGIGTVLLTDVVESTTLWELSPLHVPALLAEMQLAVDRSVEVHGGRRFGATVEGEATSSVFANALSAVRAAVALQRELTSRPGTVRLRAGLATGELVPVDRDVLGPTVSRAVRVRDLAQSGEVLLSASTADLVRTALPEGLELMSLGPHVLRDLEGTDEVAAVVTEGVSVPPNPARCPYPGLASFVSGDSDVFFGREEIVERCLELFEAQRFVAVVGASGSGKSSVLLAGVAPRLRDVVVVRPGVNPTQTLQRAGIAGHPSVVLIVDQLEELVTLCHDAAERSAFIDEAVAHPGGLIVAVRADLYGEFGTFAAFAERLASSQVLLGPLAESDLIRAVREPARRCGLTVEEGMAELIAAELGRAPGTLPLLGHALREAWLRREGRTITVAGYRDSGGVRSAVATTAEQAFAALDREGQLVARRVLLHMVELRPEAEDTRRWASRLEITEVDPLRTQDVVATLTESRLLVIDHEQITVAHEALLRAWPRLNGWIVEERANLLARQELRLATERWQAGGRSESDLYRGSRLDTAIDLAAHERLSTDEASFVTAGCELRQHELDDARRRTRRLRILAAVTSVAAALALIGGAIAVLQRNEAQRSRDEAERAQTDANAAARSARIEALVGRADSLRNAQRDTAALLAVEAFRLADTARSRSSLLATFTDAAGFLDAHRGDGFGDGIVLPGSDAAYVGIKEGGPEDGGFRSYDLETGELGEQFPVLGRPGFVGAVAASPDGALFAQAQSFANSIAPTRIGVFETASHSLRFPPVVIDGTVAGLAFIRSGNALALAVGPEGRVIILDATSGKQEETAPGVDVSDEQQSFSTVAAVDGTLVVGSADGTLRVLDAHTLEPERAVALRPGTVSKLRAVGDGTMVTAGRAGLARVDLTDGTVDWQLDEVDTCNHIAVVGDRGTFYCGDAFGGLVERDLRTGFPLRRLDTQSGNTGELWSARSGTELVSFGFESVVTRWRLDGSGAITSLVAPGYSPVGYDPTGAHLIVERAADTENYESRVVDAETGQATLDLGSFYGPTWVDANTIGGSVVVGGKLEGAIAHLDRGDVVPNGTIIDRDVAGFERDTGKQRAVLLFDDSAGTAVTSIDLTTDTFGPMIPISADQVIWMAISRTGDRIVVSTSAGVLVYDGITGEQIGAIDALGSSVFITTADQLFTGARGGALTQYDLETLQPIRTFGGSRGFIEGVVGTADGAVIATISGDRNVRLYDVATGVSLGTPITIANDESIVMALSLDGKQLAIGGEPGTGRHGIEIWDLDPDHWVAAACNIAGRNLTRAEWDTNIGDLAPYRATCPDFPADG